MFPFDSDSSLTPEQRERIARNLSYSTKHPNYASALFRALAGVRGTIFDHGAPADAKMIYAPTAAHKTEDSDGKAPVTENPDAETKTPDAETKTPQQLKAERAAANRAASWATVDDVLIECQEGSKKNGKFYRHQIFRMIVAYCNNCVSIKDFAAFCAAVAAVHPVPLANWSSLFNVESLLGDENSLADAAVWFTKSEVSSTKPDADTPSNANDNTYTSRESIAVGRFCLAVIEKAAEFASDASDPFDKYVKECFKICATELKQMTSSKPGSAAPEYPFAADKKFRNSRNFFGTPIPGTSGLTVSDFVIRRLLTTAFVDVGRRHPNVDIPVLLAIRDQGRYPERLTFDTRLSEVENLIKALVPNTDTDTGFFALAFVRWIVGGKVFTDPTTLTQRYYETKFVQAFFAALQPKDVNDQIAGALDSAANVANNSPPPSVDITEEPEEPEDSEDSEDSEAEVTLAVNGEVEIPNAKNPKKRKEPSEDEPEVNPEVNPPPAKMSNVVTETEVSEESDAPASRKRAADTDIDVTTSAPVSKKSKKDPSNVPPPSTRSTRSSSRR